jgi:hypothetical protein
MDVIREELESPSMNMASLLVIVTSDLDEDSLNSLLGTLIIFSLYIRYGDLVDPQAINALAGSLDHGAFLH